MNNQGQDDIQTSAMELPSTSNGVLPEVEHSSDEVGNVSESEKGHAKALEQAISQSDPIVATTSNSQDDDDVDPTHLDILTTLPLNPALATPKVSPNMPAIADDNDLIEKEWVEKAKHIVNQTKEDPHLQNKEMSRMKVDYLKKRYNKEVKLVED